LKNKFLYHSSRDHSEHCAYLAQSKDSSSQADKQHTYLIANIYTAALILYIDDILASYQAISSLADKPWPWI